ncbi:outer membrane protein OmpK [Aliamphritea ceti]|uniref:outer membrane protein OmpK n=1 Tax=Aliamphritea ceti TaxID=1524258 RepID=UPI0021C28AE1|nr:outer membrane protein OmpK [Aliamphritea ceti]
MKKISTTAVVLAGALVSSSVSAEQIWSDFNIAYLDGSDHELGDGNRQVITFEHASGHDWGDTFFFMDRSMSDNGTNETYFELQPRLSLSYLTGSDLSFGPVKDVYLASQWESKSDSNGGFDNYMAGVGVSLDVPGFQFFKANLYQVSNDTKKSDMQLTLGWGAPFEIGNAEFLYDGFIDLTSSEDEANHATEMNFTSQLKWNVGKAMGTKKPVYVGVEYAYWNNKFGVEGVDERSPSLLLKVHF